MRHLVILLCLAPALLAEPRLQVRNLQGDLLADAPAAFRAKGYALVPRDALAGGATAVVLDGAFRPHPVLWITGDDIDLGVAEVFIGFQAPAGVDDATETPTLFKDATHEVKVSAWEEGGSTGILGRAQCSPAHTSAQSGPLLNEHGLFAGWHAIPMVDGSPNAFVLPLPRLQAMSGTTKVTLEEWHLLNDATHDALYARGLAAMWSGDADGAKFYFQQAVQRQPAHASTWLHLAFAEGKLGHTKNRVAYLRRAIELNPSLAPARYYLGFSLMMTGDGDGAKQQLAALDKLDKIYALRLRIMLQSAHVDTVNKSDPRNLHKLAAI